jgi:hypothetical protein
MQPSVTETQLFTALRSFVIEVTGLGEKLVLRGPLNRLSMPKDGFIVMSPLGQKGLSTNTTTYGDTTKTLRRSTEWSAQIDCYGTLAGDRAQVIATAIRDSWTCRKFAELDPDVQPLYATDARQMPLVTGEQQYEQRWTFEIRLTYKPGVVLPQDSATELHVEFVEVDSAHHP